MKTILVEFPVIGYAEVEIEVADDYDVSYLNEDIENNDVEITYDGHSHVGALTPLLDMADWYKFSDGIPTELAAVDE